LPKQARALRTYDRVLDAAAYEFAQYGYASANLQNIADRIGLTKGALYGHFSNKEDLAAALAGHLEGAVQSLLEEAGSTGAPALERLRSLLLALAVLFQSDARAHAALRLAIEAAQAAGTPVPLLDRVHAIVLSLVGEVQREGSWDSSVASRPVADLIVAAFFGAYWAGSAAGRTELSGRVGAMWNILALVLRGAVGR
jgi:AcrR family transcriptional regulator